MCDREKQLLNSEMKSKLVTKTVMKQIKPKKQHRKNNPEKDALQRKKRLQRIGDDKDITCQICQYDVKKYKFKQDENSVGHQNLLL